MAWSVGINLLGFGIVVIGALLLIWSLLARRGEITAVGVGFLISGFLLQILAAFIE
jgi:hypothetical protein